MVAFKVSINTQAVIKSLTSVQKRQIPFAIAGALTATAFDAQRAIKANLKKKFILRNRFTETGVRVIKANKQTQTATVMFADNRFYMSRQEYGGTIRPSNKHLAIPQKIRRSKRTRITPAKRPRRILDNKNTFKIDIGVKSHLQPGIYQRINRNKKVKMLYAFEKSIRIKPRLGFEKTVRGIVNRKFDGNFNKSLARALKFAR